MLNKYPLIAAAVAAAVASGYANAAGSLSTLAEAAAATNTLVMAGSSAAKNAIAAGIAADLCGGSSNVLTMASAGGSKNFLAYSCHTAVAVTGTPGVPAGSIVTIYYRSEGGSVVGALPVATGHTVLRLNLSDTTCTATGNSGTCTVTGTTGNGTTDSFTGAVIADTVQLGVTDVEPAQLVSDDYPNAYSTTAFGSATPAQMAGLNKVKLLQQVFGLMVNTSGQTFTSVNLTKESAANILAGAYSDWTKVPDALTGNKTSSAVSAPITRIDRENGSGTRTSANMYFLNYHCGSTSHITNAPLETLYFATDDELNAANGKAGAIAYAGIDNILNPSNQTKWTNLVLATINGVTPSNLAAATGQYDFWFEAALVPNGSVGSTTVSGNLSSFLQTSLPKLANAPQVPSVNVIPGVGGNIGTVPLTNNGATTTTKTVYVNPYTRGGNSCAVPTETN